MPSLYARLDLIDWRRRVAALYASVRRLDEPIEVRHARFWAGRDALFREHPSSPLDADDRIAFEGVPRLPYDPALRILAAPEPIETPAPIEASLGDDGLLVMTPAARVRFQVHGEPCELTLYWLRGYGGGLFLPFRDGTSGDTTYGGGRYLLDTAKHADLGEDTGPAGERRIVLDFNFAYHPSCVYSPHWDCPLAPPENRLRARIQAGETLAAAYGT